MHYAHNKNPSFAAARVTKNSLTLKYYQVTHDEKYQMLYEYVLFAEKPEPPAQQSSN